MHRCLGAESLSGDSGLEHLFREGIFQDGDEAIREEEARTGLQGHREGEELWRMQTAIQRGAIECQGCLSLASASFGCLACAKSSTCSGTAPCKLQKQWFRVSTAGFLIHAHESFEAKTVAVRKRGSGPRRWWSRLGTSFGATSGARLLSRGGRERQSEENQLKARRVGSQAAAQVRSAIKRVLKIIPSAARKHSTPGMLHERSMGSKVLSGYVYRQRSKSFQRRHAASFNYASEQRRAGQTPTFFADGRPVTPFVLTISPTTLARTIVHVAGAIHLTLKSVRLCHYRMAL